nr:hypothetical protein [Tanacetum cinerariifolium]
NVGNHVVQNAVQNPGVQNVGNQNGLIVVPGIANQNSNRNGNVVVERAEGNAIGNNGNLIRCYNCIGLGYLARNCTVRPKRRDVAYLQTQLLIAQKEEAGIQLQAEEFNLMAAAADLYEIEEVNANCILMAKLQQASTSGTQTNKALVCDSDGSAEVYNYDNCYDNEIFNMFTQEEQYTELLKPILEPHQVQHNDSNVISEVSSVEQDWGTVDQHLATVKETCTYLESLYNNLAIEVEKNVGNHVVQNAVQNPGVQNVGNQNGLIVVPGIANQNSNRNGNVVVERAEGNAIGNNGNLIRCYNCIGLGYLARNCTVRPKRRDVAYLQTQLLIAQKEEAGIQLQAEEFNLMAAAADLYEIEEVNANCILMAKLQQASTSGTQTNKALVCDSDGSAEVYNYDNCYDNEIFNMFTQEEQYTELLKPILEPHQVQHNDSNVISEVSSVEQDWGTVDQHLATVKETCTYLESLYNNLAIEVEKVNSVNHKIKETNDDLTTKLARYKNQEKCFEISQEKYDKLERCYQKSVIKINVSLKR